MNKKILDIARYSSTTIESIVDDASHVDIAFVDCKSERFSVEIRDKFLEELNARGKRVIKIDGQLGLNEGFELSSSISNIPLNGRPSDWKDYDNDDEKLGSYWHKISVSRYQYSMYEIYSKIAEDLIKSSEEEELFLLISSIRFSNINNYNLMRLLIEDVKKTSGKIRVIFFFDDHFKKYVEELQSFSTIIQELDIKKIQFPLPEILGLETHLQNNGHSKAVATSTAQKIAHLIALNSLEYLSSEILAVFDELGSDHNVEPKREPRRSFYEAFTKWHSHTAFDIASKKLLNGTELTTLEWICLLNFSYFYPYSHLIEELKKARDHESPLVRLSTLKVTALYSDSSTLNMSKLKDSSIVVVDYILSLKSPEPALVHDTYFTLVRLWMILMDEVTDRIFQEDEIEWLKSLIFRLVDYCRSINIEDLKKIELVTKFFVNPLSFDYLSEEMKKCYRLFLEEQKKDSFEFIVKKNLRFMSLFSISSEKIFPDSSTLEFDLFFSIEEDRIQRVSSAIGNTLIARTNRAKQYVIAGQPSLAAKLYKEISLIRDSIQITHCSVEDYANGHLAMLMNSYGVGFDKRIVRFEKQEPECYSISVEAVNKILLNENLPDFKDIVFNVCHAFMRNRKEKSTNKMFTPLVLHYAARNGFPETVIKDIYDTCLNAFILDENEQRLVNIILKKSIKDNFPLCVEALKSNVQANPPRKSGQIIALSILARHLKQYNHYATTLLRIFFDLTLSPWLKPEEKISSAGSWLFADIFLSLRPSYQSGSFINIVSSSSSFKEPLLRLSLLFLSATPAKKVIVRYSFVDKKRQKKTHEIIHCLRQGQSYCDYEESDYISDQMPVNGNVTFEYTETAFRYLCEEHALEIILDYHDEQDECDHRMIDVLSELIISPTFKLFRSELQSIKRVAITSQEFAEFQDKTSATIKKHNEAHAVISNLHRSILTNNGLITLTITDTDLNLNSMNPDYFFSIFQSENIPKTFSELLMYVDNLDEEKKSIAVQCLSFIINDSEISFDMNSSNLPIELGLFGKIFSASWSYVREDDSIVHTIILSMKDITREKFDEEANRKREIRSEIISAFQQNDIVRVGLFVDSLKENLDYLSEINTPQLFNGSIQRIPDYAENARILHRLKGASRTFSLDRLSRIIHEAESQLLDISDQLEYMWRYYDYMQSIKTDLFTESTEDIDMVNALIALASNSDLANNPIFQNSLNTYRLSKMHKNLFSVIGKSVLSADLTSKISPEISLKVSGENCPDQLEINQSIRKFFDLSIPHLIRNSIDHGIEKIDQRVKLGKPQRGCIHVECHFALNVVQIQIRDDGGGIDRDLLISKLSKNHNCLGLSDSELLDKLCSAGISTKDSVTESSGRGVALESVWKEVQELGGQFQMLPSEFSSSERIYFTTKITLPFISSSFSKEESWKIKKPA